MMSRLLLLLCCATVLVSGTRGDSPLSNLEHSSVPKELVQPKVTEQPVEAPVLSNKTKDPVHSLPPLDKIVDNDTKAHEGVSPQSHSDDEHPKPTPPSTVAPKTHATPKTTVAPQTSTTTVTPAPTSTSVPSTTSASNTTTEPITTVAPPSTPVPAPSAGKWIVNGTDKICIIAQMAVQFNISYVNNNNMTVYKVFDMPADNATTVATGICGKQEQNLTLQWPSFNHSSDTMTLHFVKNETTNHYSLHHLEIVLPAEDFPGTNITGKMVFVHEASSFSTGLSNSYRCVKQQRLGLKLNNTNELASYLTVSDLQFQAFKADNATVFGLAKDCAFDTPDVVPIAVGCALAGLVVIVLITYLVGRRRSQARGYLSM